jgi:hypothetical protein
VGIFRSAGKDIYISLYGKEYTIGIFINHLKQATSNIKETLLVKERINNKNLYFKEHRKLEI